MWSGWTACPEGPGPTSGVGSVYQLRLSRPRACGHGQPTAPCVADLPPVRAAQRPTGEPSPPLATDTLLDPPRPRDPRPPCVHRVCVPAAAQLSMGPVLNRSSRASSTRQSMSSSRSPRQYRSATMSPNAISPVFYRDVVSSKHTHTQPAARISPRISLSRARAHALSFAMRQHHDLGVSWL